jgi:carboxymethylenebutenolidase
VSYEHIHWDQANVLVQLGLLDPTLLPVVGAGAAAKLRNSSLPDPFFHEG